MSTLAKEKEKEGKTMRGREMDKEKWRGVKTRERKKER